MLVGRSTECARIDELLGRARDGYGGALVLRGEPGIGKTALLRFAADESGDMLVLEAQGVQTESELPFAGLSQLLAPLIERVDRLPRPQRRALMGALGLDAEGPRERFAAYVAAVGLIADAANDRPVLALIDDVQWLDSASVEAIVFVARRLGEEPVVMLLSERDSDAAASRLPRLTEIELRGLASEASARLLQAMSPIPIHSAVLAQLHRETTGNPLALAECARTLSHAQLGGAEALPAPLPAGAGLERSFGARVAALDQAVQRALLIAAAEHSGDVPALERALRSRALDLYALEQAEAAGLVRLGDGRIEFSHPLLRSAAYYRADPAARRDAHAALAAALDANPAQRARRAFHLAAASLQPSEEIAVELEEVAREAHARAAPTAAARAFEAAARLSSAGEPRSRRLLGAARAHHLAGRPGHALTLLEDALSGASDPLMRADVQRARAQVQAMTSAPLDSREILLKEADLVEPHDRARATAMRIDAVYASMIVGEPRVGLELAERAWPAAKDAGGPLRLAASLMLGTARVLCGDAAHGYPLLQEARPLLHADGIALAPYLVASVGMADLWVERYAEATQSLNEWVRAMRADGALTALPHTLYALAFSAYYVGDWAAAQAHAEESLALASEVTQDGFLGVPETLLALVDGGRGRFAEARRRLDHADALAREFSAGSMRTMAGWTRGLIELAAGEHGAAIAALEPTGRFTLERGMLEPGAAPWAQDLAEAYVRAGRVEDAEKTLAVLQHQAERTGRRLAHAGARRCRGLVAREEDFERHFRAALAHHDAVACPFERARTELCFGERLRRARRRSEAREPLRRALDVFDALAAEPWAERARRELRATGERVRRRTPDTLDDLTPQELQVSLIVAEGATNREAAATLFVTPKTIETHLNHVYRKLGVRSRVELAAYLSQTAGTRSVNPSRPAVRA